MSLTWTAPVWMWPLLLVLAAGAVIWSVWVYGRTVPRPGPGLGRVLLALRAAALMLLVVAMAGPVLFRLLARHEAPVLAVVMEDSASMGLTDLPDTTLSRWQRGLAFSARLDSALSAGRWPGEVVFLRGNGLAPVQEFRLNDPVIPDPNAHGTDLASLQRQVGEYLVGRQVPAALLLSDGQETRPLSGPAQRPQSGAHPSHATNGAHSWLVAGVGSIEGSADRLLKDLRYPDTAYAGDEVVVDLAVTHRFLEGPPPGEVVLTLREDGRTLVEETHHLVDQTTNLSLSFKAPEEGLRVLDLTVSPLDNERFLANNRMSLVVNVRPDRSRLLLLAAQPGWDARFLAQAARMEQRLELDVVYRSAEGMVLADSARTWTSPTTAPSWQQWDGVVLEGWRSGTLAVDWPSLEEAVRQGLGLLVLPGAAHPQARLVDSPPAALERLLPVTATNWRWLDGPLQARVPVEALRHPVAQLGMGQDAADPLAGMPPLRAALGVEARPGAVVLMEGSAAGDVILPLLVLDGTGPGRRAFFGGRRLWELAFWEPAGRWEDTAVGLSASFRKQPVRAMVRNLLVWLATGQEEGGLVFTGGRTYFQEGEKMTLAATWRDMRGVPVTDRAVSLEVSGPLGEPGAETRGFSMNPVVSSPGQVQVELPPLPPGRYELALRGQGDPPVAGGRTAVVVTSHSIEATQVRQDRRRLHQLASRGAGDLVQAGDDGALVQVLAAVDRLDWSGRDIRQRRRLDFWSGWPFLVMVVVLLGSEWFLRRRNGLL